MPKKTNSKKTIGTAVAENPLLAEIDRILALGVFSPSKDDPIERGEEAIGEMNDFEKAIWTVGHMHLDNYVTKEFEILDATTPEAKEAAHKAAQCEEQICDDIFNFMWANIQLRLGKKASKGNALDIRTGYQIVACYDPDPPVEIVFE
ncbi:MAG TPA: hypothetical protein VN437_02460 [Rectinemataceae bacterium]|nr:hypothetical protein [Rectinemataceae bacterium]